jgi:hypothetical protein
VQLHPVVVREHPHEAARLYSEPLLMEQGEAHHTTHWRSWILLIARCIPLRLRAMEAGRSRPVSTSASKSSSVTKGICHGSRGGMTLIFSAIETAEGDEKRKGLFAQTRKMACKAGRQKQQGKDPKHPSRENLYEWAESPRCGSQRLVSGRFESRAHVRRKRSADGSGHPIALNDYAPTERKHNEHRFALHLIRYTLLPLPPFPSFIPSQLTGRRRLLPRASHLGKKKGKAEYCSEVRRLGPR